MQPQRAWEEAISQLEQMLGSPLCSPPLPPRPLVSPLFQPLTWMETCHASSCQLSLLLLYPQSHQFALLLICLSSTRPHFRLTIVQSYWVIHKVKCIYFQMRYKISLNFVSIYLASLTTCYMQNMSYTTMCVCRQCVDAHMFLHVYIHSWTRTCCICDWFLSWGRLSGDAFICLHTLLIAVV